MNHTQSPIEAIEASATGALAGFESRCTCGLVMRNTIRWNLLADVREHAAWHAAPPRRTGGWIARRNEGLLRAKELAR